MDTCSGIGDSKHLAFTTLLWDADFSRIVSPLINKAQDLVYLTSFKMEPKNTPKGQRLKKLISLLVSAKNRGVDVRILLNFQENKKSTSSVNWYASKALSKRGVKVRYVQGGRILHAKVLTLDHDFSVIGSHNWSILSHDRNIELSVLIGSSKVTRDVIEILDHLWERSKDFPI